MNYKPQSFISALESYKAILSRTIFWAHEREKRDWEHSGSLIIPDQACYIP